MFVKSKAYVSCSLCYRGILKQRAGLEIGKKINCISLLEMMFD